MLTIGVDIDGVLTIETEGHDYENRTPNLDGIFLINSLADEGIRIHLFTSRWGSDKDITKKWLNKYGVIYHDIIFDKPNYDIYIDDRAVNPNCLECQKKLIF